MERIEEPIEVLAHKVFPSGAQLTKVKVGGHVVYVRENVGPDLEGSAPGPEREGSDPEPKSAGPELIQILELSAPAEVWAKVAAVIALEDHLKRPVHSVEFSDWAEAELSK